MREIIEDPDRNKVTQTCHKGVLYNRSKDYIGVLRGGESIAYALTALFNSFYFCAFCANQKENATHTVVIWYSASNSDSNSNGQKS